MGRRDTTFYFYIIACVGLFYAIIWDCEDCVNDSNNQGK
jgi:hypothetical protein